MTDEEQPEAAADMELPADLRESARQIAQQIAANSTPEQLERMVAEVAPFVEGASRVIAQLQAEGDAAASRMRQAYNAVRAQVPAVLLQGRGSLIVGGVLLPPVTMQATATLTAGGTLHGSAKLTPFGNVELADSGAAADTMESAAAPERIRRVGLAGLSQRELLVVVLAWLIAAVSVAKLAYGAELDGQAVVDSFLTNAPGWAALAVAITTAIYARHR